MKKKILLIIMSLMTVVSMLTLTGCSGMDKAVGVIQRAHTVVLDATEVLTEVEGMIAGSELATKLGDKIESVKKSLVLIDSTIQNIANIIGADLTVTVIKTDDVTADLKLAMLALEKENDKLAKELK